MTLWNSMKKFNSLILFFILCLGFIFPCLSSFSKDIENSQAILISESDINFIQDIVGTKLDDMDYSLRADAVLNQNPFNKTTELMMEGYSIVPTANANNEIYNKSYKVSDFSFDSHKSIFMWIYLPDNPYTNLFNLSITFSNSIGTKSALWDFKYDTLYEMMSFATKYGWKLFELSYDDCQAKNLTSDEETIFTQMRIDYTYPVTDAEDIFTNGKLSFYHVYLGSKIESTSNIALQPDYINYGIKSSFEKGLQDLCYNDRYTVGSIDKVFDYIYVGRYNLLLNGSHNNKFEWEMNIKNDDGITDVSSGYNYLANTLGTNSFNIILRELRSSKQIDLLSLEFNFDCREYNFGNFTNNNYELKESNTIVLNFKIGNNFSKQGDIDVKVSNDEILKVNSCIYDFENDCYLIRVTGLKKGSASVIVYAEGVRFNGDYGEYKVSTKINVKKESKGIFTKNTWFVILGIYILAMVVFGSITLVNLKRAKQLKN